MRRANPPKLIRTVATFVSCPIKKKPHSVIFANRGEGREKKQNRTNKEKSKPFYAVPVRLQNPKKVLALCSCDSLIPLLESEDHLLSSPLSRSCLSFIVSSSLAYAKEPFWFICFRDISAISERNFGFARIWRKQGKFFNGFQPFCYAVKLKRERFWENQSSCDLYWFSRNGKYWKWRQNGGMALPHSF